MHWFIEIGILILGYFANKAIASIIRSRQKPPFPGAFAAPTVAPGQGITVSYGTTRGAAVCAAIYQAKLVEVNVSTLMPITRIGTRTTVGYQYKITALFILGWGPLTTIANMMFGDKSLADQPMTQSYQDGDGSTLIVPTFGGERNFIVAGDYVGPQGGNIEVYGGGRAAMTLTLPNIFGGRGRGGGFTAVGGDTNNPYGGYLLYYMGSRQTGPDPVLESFAGVGNVPNYNDLAYVVFDDVNVGESPVPPAIDWIYMRVPQAPTGFFYSFVNSRVIPGRYWSWKMIDANPAGMLYDILRNPLYGLDQPKSAIIWSGIGLSDGTSGDFADAAAALGAENLGMSMRFAGDRQSVQDAIKEIERTVDGSLNRDPVTFQWTFKLHRNEAATADRFNALRELTNKEIVALKPLNQQLWSETFNVITVEFSDATRFFEKNTVTLRNGANIAMTGGERAAPNVQYMGITDRDTAVRLAARDLKKLSMPLWKGQMKVTRSGWDLERGDVFKLTYAKYGFAQKLMRVVDVDFGDESDSTISVDVIEDVFHYEATLRTSGRPPNPRRFPSIIAPVITNITQEIVKSPGSALGVITFTVLDAEHRITAIETRTQTADGTPSGWTLLASSTADTSDPTFAFNNHVTVDDLNGTYGASVALSYLGASTIEIRLTYIGYGIVSDPTGDMRTVDQVVTFDALSTLPTEGTLDGSVCPIRWDVTGLLDDSRTTTIGGNCSVVILGAMVGFRGKLLITSTGVGGYTFTLPPGSIYGDGSSLNVTLGLKDQLSVYFDGTYYWWNLDTHATTLPPVSLDASWSVHATLTADFRGMEASLTLDGTTTGDLSI